MAAYQDIDWKVAGLDLLVKGLQKERYPIFVVIRIGEPQHPLLMLEFI